MFIFLITLSQSSTACSKQERCFSLQTDALPARAELCPLFLWLTRLLTTRWVLDLLTETLWRAHVGSGFSYCPENKPEVPQYQLWKYLPGWTSCRFSRFAFFPRKIQVLQSSAPGIFHRINLYQRKVLNRCWALCKVFGIQEQIQQRLVV